MRSRVGSLEARDRGGNVRGRTGRVLALESLETRIVLSTIGGEDVLPEDLSRPIAPAPPELPSDVEPIPVEELVAEVEATARPIAADLEAAVEDSIILIEDEVTSTMVEMGRMLDAEVIATTTQFEMMVAEEVEGLEVMAFSALEEILPESESEIPNDRAVELVSSSGTVMKPLTPMTFVEDNITSNDLIEHILFEVFGIIPSTVEEGEFDSPYFDGSTQSISEMTEQLLYATFGVLPTSQQSETFSAQISDMADVLLSEEQATVDSIEGDSSETLEFPPIPMPTEFDGDVDLTVMTGVGELPTDTDVDPAARSTTDDESDGEPVGNEDGSDPVEMLDELDVPNPPTPSSPSDLDADSEIDQALDGETEMVTTTSVPTESEDDLTVSTIDDVAVTGVTATSSSSVTVRYTIDDDGAFDEPGDEFGPVLDGLTLVVRRAADADSGGAQEIGRVTLSGADLTDGDHEVEVTVDPLIIKPSMPFVVAEIDPEGQLTESDETNNRDGFRKHVVAAVTHGYQPDAKVPAWVGTLADSLIEVGYDEAIAYDWALSSSLPTPGQVEVNAQSLADAIQEAASGLEGLSSDDVIDVHLIGHSRGGNLVAAASGLLDQSESSPLADGFVKVTMLDPHPARNGDVAFYDASNGPLGRFSELLYLAFQEGTKDPALTVPESVDQAEIFYQRTPVEQATGLGEPFVNLWGATPAGGRPATYYDLTSTVRSHAGLIGYYQQSVVPTLASASLFSVAPGTTPETPSNGGGSLFNVMPRQTPGAARAEFNTLRTLGVDSGTAANLIRSVDSLNASMEQGRFFNATFTTQRLVQYINSQANRTIPEAVADSLLSTLEVGQFIAGLGDPSVS